MWKNIKGFTLIELMIVIAILGIMVSILIPNIVAYKEKQKNTQIEMSTKISPTNDSFSDEESRY